MLVPVATGPRVRSGWPRQGQQTPSILVCPQGLSRKEWDSSVSIVPGEGFHMLGGGGRRHRIEHTYECLYKRDSGRKGGADLIPEWVACGQG